MVAISFLKLPVADSSTLLPAPAEQRALSAVHRTHHRNLQRRLPAHRTDNTRSRIVECRPRSPRIEYSNARLLASIHLTTKASPPDRAIRDENNHGCSLRVTDKNRLNYYATYLVEI
jgi:hypothetical protein